MSNSVNTVYSFNISEILYITLIEPNTPLWFVRNLIVYTLLAPIVLPIMRSKGIAVMVIFLLQLLSFILHVGYSSILYFLPLYLIGAYIGANHKNYVINKSFDTSHYFVTGAILLSFCIISVFVSNEDYYIFYVYRLIAPFCLWILSDSFLKGVQVPKFCSYSFFIFVNHFFWLTAIHKIFKITVQNLDVVLLLNYTVAPLIVILATIAFAWILEKYLPVTYRLLSGGR